MTNKQMCYELIEQINDLIASKATIKKQSLSRVKEEIINNRLSIQIVGIRPLWKTILQGKSSIGISEGFKSWKEVEIFLRGFKRALTM